MSIRLLGNANHVVIELNGRFEGLAAFDFFIVAEKAKRASTSGTIEVDLAGVEFIDLFGMRRLICLDRQMRAHGGRAVLTNAPPDAMRAFHTLGIDKEMRFTPEPAGPSARY